MRRRHEFWTTAGRIHLGARRTFQRLLDLPFAHGRPVEHVVRRGRIERVSYWLAEGEDFAPTMARHVRRYPGLPTSLTMRQATVAAHVWTLEVAVDEAGAVEEYRQALRHPTLDDVIMTVARDLDGSISSIEKVLAPGPGREYHISYHDSGEVAAVFDFARDDEDCYWDDVRGLLGDDPRFYENAFTLPAAIGPGARIPDAPALGAVRGSS